MARGSHNGAGQAAAPTRRGSAVTHASPWGGRTSKRSTEGPRFRTPSKAALIGGVGRSACGKRSGGRWLRGEKGASA